MHEYTDRAALLLDNARLFDVARRVITEQRETQTTLEKTEEFLKLNEKKFKSIFDTSLDPIIILDRNMKIVDINPATTQLLLTQKRKLLTMKIIDFVSNETRKQFQSDWKKLQKKEFLRGEIEIIRPNDTTRIIEYSAKSEALPEQHLFIFRDITERVEEEKRREHLLSIASHELRTPLASIRIFVEILKRSLIQLANTTVDQYLSKIDDKTESLSRMLDDLLDITRIRQNKLELFYEMVATDSFIDDVIKDIQVTTKTHKISKVGNVERDIILDKNRISEVIINLIRNAIKYSPESEKVIVKVEALSENLQIAVQDFGIGIPVKEHKKIFDIFYRSDSTSRKKIEGLGLGLFIAAEIVKKHGGKIDLKSKKNEGSTFTVTLPFIPKKAKIKVKE